MLRTITEGDYNDVLQAAVVGGTLPDVVEVDGPMVSSFASQDALVPLDGLLPARTLADQLPSLRDQGTVDGETYAVGTFDSGLGLYADRRQLERAGITWPTGYRDAWTAAEFTDVLERLARGDDDGQVLDTKVNYGVGEWLTYGFAPLVASAGGQLLDPETGEAAGHLDSSAAREALGLLSNWSRYVDPNAEDDAFVERRVALSWVGHWEYPRYTQALGDDLLVLPLPDLGHGAKTGQGSWAWGVTADDGAHASASADFVDFLLSEREVLRMADANGAVPGTQAALPDSTLYQPDGPLRLFADQLLAGCGAAEPTPDCVAVPRPMTPGYPLLSSQFATAVSKALAGKDATAALLEAARLVDRDREVNGDWR